jgi:predicted N-acetyltransferase YhbS
MEHRAQSEGFLNLPHARLYCFLSPYLTDENFMVKYLTSSLCKSASGTSYFDS